MPLLHRAVAPSCMTHAKQMITVVVVVVAIKPQCKAANLGWSGNLDKPAAQSMLISSFTMPQCFFYAGKHATEQLLHSYSTFATHTPPSSVRYHTTAPLSKTWLHSPSRLVHDNIACYMYESHSVTVFCCHTVLTPTFHTTTMSPHSWKSCSRQEMRMTL